MRILVCGGRDYDDKDTVWNVLDQYIHHHGTLIHGGCSGADLIAESWARFSAPHWAIERYDADWAKYGKAAGPIRNKRMLETGRPSLVIAFPGGKGTANMIEIARKAAVPVRVVRGPA